MPNTNRLHFKKVPSSGYAKQPRLNSSRIPNWDLLSNHGEPLFFLFREAEPEGCITFARQIFDPEFNRMAAVKSNSPTQSLHLTLVCVEAWLGSAADKNDISPSEASP